MAKKEEPENEDESTCETIAGSSLEECELETPWAPLLGPNYDYDVYFLKEQSCPPSVHDGKSERPHVPVVVLHEW